MEQANIATNAPVYCADGLLGTYAGLRDGPNGRLLAVRPDDGGELLLVPVSYASTTADGRLVVNLDCSAARSFAAQPAGDAAGVAIGQAGEVMRVPLVEEQLVARTQWREAGVLEVARTIRTEVQELDVPLQYEQASVSRVPVNRVLGDDEVLQVRQEGEVTVVPVVQEELVVLKRRVLVEELHISKQVVTRTQHVAEEVRREEIALNHPGLTAQPAAGDQP